MKTMFLNKMKSYRKFFSSEVLANSQAFTLTELLIVIALIAMLGTFVTQNVVGKFNKSKVNLVSSDFGNAKLWWIRRRNFYR